MTPPNRAARRRAKAGARADLRARIEGAPLPGTPGAVANRSRAALLAWIDAARAQAWSEPRIAAALASGEAATRISARIRETILSDPPPTVRNAACAMGCAWCCVLDGPDGGTVSEAEARHLYAALAPLAGRPDGRDWHPMACPSLDPETRACRAYEDRPALCRSFVSTDPEACRENASGGAMAGAGLIASHLDHLAILALARAALGPSRVPTYALREVAAGAVEGLGEEEALARARHPEKRLTQTRREMTAAAGS